MRTSRSRFKKILFSALLGVCLVGGLVALLTPSLLSTKLGNEKFLSIINHRIPGKIAFKNLSVSWRGVQRIEGLTLYDPEGSLVLSAESIETETPLYSFLSSGPLVGKSKIKSFNAQIKKTPLGITNLQESLGMKASLFEFPEEMASVSNVDLELDCPQSADGFMVKTVGVTQHGKIAGKFDIDLLWSHLDNSCDMHVENFPTTILDSILAIRAPQTAGLLLALLGDAIDMKITQEYREGKSAWIVESVSKNIQFKAQGVIEEGIFHLTSPAHIKLTLTAAGIDLISQKYEAVKNLPISPPLHLTLEMTQLHVPLSLLTHPSGRKEFVEFDLNGKMDLPDPFVNYLGKTLSFHLLTPQNKPKSFQLSMSSPKLDIRSMELALDQDIYATQAINNRDLSGLITIEELAFPTSREHSFLRSVNIPWKISQEFRTLDLNVSGFVSSRQQEGKFHADAHIHSKGTLQDSDFRISFNGNQIPSSLIEFTSGRNEFGPLFGSNVDVNLSLNFNQQRGNIKSTLLGSTGSFAINASVDDKNIRLNEPLRMSTKGSSELGRKVLGQWAPVFNELISSEGEFKVVIDPKDFILPMDPFDLASLNIGSAVIDLGKMTFNNKGEIKDLISILRPVRSDLIGIWATPIYWKINQGVISISRADLLIMDRYPLATWGKIDLVKDNVKMVIGVSGVALSQAFDLPKLDKNTLIQVPVTGQMSKVKIDTAKVGTKIGTLLAQQSGSPHGMILGAVLELAKGKEEAAPPPTTSPLPWEGRDFQLNTADRETRKTRSMEQKDPAKEIQKEASKFLKSLLR